MMTPFTHANTTCGTSQAALIPIGSPTTPTSGPNEHQTAAATSPTSCSLEKQCAPSTPTSTLLHQRFLRKASMSPATPPRTPASRRESPTKVRESPAGGFSTPSRKDQTPIKLEVSQNGFYFCMELPPSKITPKKRDGESKCGTPRKEDGTETPSRTRTCSPLKSTKSHSPDKQSPAQALSGTPTRRGAARTPDSHRRSRSPIRRTVDHRVSVETGARLTRKLASTTVQSLRIPTGCLGDVVEDVVIAPPDRPAIIKPSEERAPNEKPDAIRKPWPNPETIGHLMAGLSSSGSCTPKTRGRASDTPRKNDEVTVSPAPTPLRKASQRLGLSGSPSFSRLPAQGPTLVERARVAADGQETDPSTLRETNLHPSEQSGDNGAAPVREEPQKVWLGNSPAVQESEPESNMAASRPPQPKRPLSMTALYTTARKAQDTIQYPPLLFPKPDSETSPEPMPDPKKRIKRQELEQPDQSRQPRPQQPARQRTRVGTDPSVLLTLQKEMANTEAEMRRSAGIINPALYGPPNLNELPAISNSFSTRDAQDTTSPDPADIPLPLSRVNSNTSSRGQVRAANQPPAQTASARAPSTPGSSRFRPTVPTPAQAKRDRLATAKQAAKQDVGKEKMPVPATPRTRSMGAALSGPGKTAAAAIATPAKVASTPAKVASTCAKIASTPAKVASTPAKVASTPAKAAPGLSRIPSTTPAKMKTPMKAVPQSVKKVVDRVTNAAPITPMKLRSPTKAIPQTPIKPALGASANKSTGAAVYTPTKSKSVTKAIPQSARRLAASTPASRSPAPVPKERSSSLRSVNTPRITSTRTPLRTPSTPKLASETPVKRSPAMSISSTTMPQKGSRLRGSSSTLTSAQSTPRKTPLRKPLVPLTKEPYNPSADPRPYEQQFASAEDIADRLGRWHDEDRKRAETEKPGKGVGAKVGLRAPGKIPGKVLGKTATDIAGKTPTKAVGKTPGKAPGKMPTLSLAKTPTPVLGKTPTPTLGKTPTPTLGKPPTKVPAKIPGKGPTKVPTKTPADITRDGLQGAPAKTHPRTPGKIPTKTTAKTPAKTPAKAPGKTPGRLFAGTPNKPPPSRHPTPSTTPKSTPPTTTLELAHPFSSTHLHPPTPTFTPTPSASPTPLSFTPTPSASPSPSPSTPLSKRKPPFKYPITPLPAPHTPITRCTPANIAAADRNATRTPSKRIVSSLDKAIDEKIAEDARRGLEFTPGGNRVRDLLEARGRTRERAG
ncbi:KAR9 multi-domain protein [Pyrenophora teres f. teres]|uniref:KAR9 multi-domain protein n=1 Tax=Pyrenophora teres f. teres TaxID=97479 RepID=A0A6S6VES1_9PLEO|nr:hypothetical protein PTNB29_04697 [Pyrenophora teres f. teres]CAE6995101.1 KAR9 multi-domain protein [Pyrenophora teres f. teres]